MSNSIINTWTPVLTFATPGDLSVVYTTQLGLLAFQNGLYAVFFNIVTSTFTHSTASGALQITGAPIANNSALNIVGALAWSGITKANYTDIAAQFAASATPTINFRASGSGQAVANLTTADVPSGGTMNLRGTIMFVG